MNTLFPLKSIPVVWHVGTMEPAKKRSGSHEGAGLSVSLHPDAWRLIARGQVVGDYWRLSKADSHFLDAHAMSEEQREMVAAWGVEHGFVTRKTLFRVSWFDDELDQDCYQLCESHEAALAEVEDEENVEAVENCLIATSLLKDRTKSDAPSVLVHDLLLTLYAEDELSLDGVWWEDRLDIYAYSAPRGVIFPAMVKGWVASHEPDFEPEPADAW